MRSLGLLTFANARCVQHAHYVLILPLSVLSPYGARGEGHGWYPCPSCSGFYCIRSSEALTSCRMRTRSLMISRIISALQAMCGRAADIPSPVPPIRYNPHFSGQATPITRVGAPRTRDCVLDGYLRARYGAPNTGPIPRPIRWSQAVPAIRAMVGSSSVPSTFGCGYKGAYITGGDLRAKARPTPGAGPRGGGSILRPLQGAQGHRLAGDMAAMSATGTTRRTASK